MKKLYYDCPIEAAYMAKNFGVRFNIIAKSDKDNFFMWEVRPEYNEGQILHVHPESLSIFEPQLKDMLRNKKTGGITLGVYQGLLDHNPKAIENDDIIYRNNKPFIMPKEEV